ncbi:hypothetical protein VPH35_007751 [Triticum aestivum]
MAPDRADEAIPRPDPPPPQQPLSLPLPIQIEDGGSHRIALPSSPTVLPHCPFHTLSHPTSRFRSVVAPSDPTPPFFSNRTRPRPAPRVPSLDLLRAHSRAPLPPCPVGGQRRHLLGWISSEDLAPPPPPPYHAAASYSPPPVSDTMDSVKDILGKMGKRFGEAARKTENITGNFWQHREIRFSSSLLYCRHAVPAGGCFFRGKEEIFKKMVPEADAASSD